MEGMVAMELTAQAHTVGAGVDVRGHRQGRGASAASRLVPAPALRYVPANEADAWSPAQLESLWNRHGGWVYACACALLGDEAAAARTVTLAMVDLALSARSESREDTLRFLARRVYAHSREAVVSSSGTSDLPPVLVWLGQLAQLQRACLALCVYGGLMHREAADLLGIPPGRVAELLTAGLRELGHLAGGGATTSA